MYSVIRVLGAFWLITCAFSQTPQGTTPSTENLLSVKYGSTVVTPGIKLEQARPSNLRILLPFDDSNPSTETSTIPIVNYQAGSTFKIYTLLLVDLSIPSSRVNASQLEPEQLPVATGVGVNRTTRLHFWQAGLTFSNNATLVNTTQPVALYNGPQPPAGDIAHDYVFYLFEQGAGFAPPSEDSPFNVNNVNTKPNNRASFSVQRFAASEGVGDLVAANYIQVQNPASGSGGSSTSNGTAGPSATSSTTSTTGNVGAAAPSPFTGSAGKVGVQGWSISIVLALVMGLLG
ncbi:MAG: hypothetical protein L6R41_004497 [Letrouitia leprolyta]|nr:MAG: hypothetical protein L6R41_004497 [Letrouitia leprolyta]